MAGLRGVHTDITTHPHSPLRVHAIEQLIEQSELTAVYQAILHQCGAIVSDPKYESGSALEQIDAIVDSIIGKLPYMAVAMELRTAESAADKQRVEAARKYKLLQEKKVI